MINIYVLRSTASGELSPVSTIASYEVKKFLILESSEFFLDSSLMLKRRTKTLTKRNNVLLLLAAFLAFSFSHPFLVSGRKRIWQRQANCFCHFLRLENECMTFKFAFSFDDERKDHFVSQVRTTVSNVKQLVANIFLYSRSLVSDCDSTKGIWRY